jgi:uncharacterized protein with HEPN domain
MKSDEVFLRHILEEINFLMQNTRNLSFDDFGRDEVLKRACARSFEIIGEAAKNTSAEFRKKHKDVDWKGIAGLRDKLIHKYFGVNWNILWDVIRERLPELKSQVAAMMRREK